MQRHLESVKQRRRVHKHARLQFLQDSGRLTICKPAPINSCLETLFGPLLSIPSRRKMPGLNISQFTYDVQLASVCFRTWRKFIFDVCAILGWIFLRSITARLSVKNSVSYFYMWAPSNSHHPLWTFFFCSRAPWAGISPAPSISRYLGFLLCLPPLCFVLYLSRCPDTTVSDTANLTHSVTLPPPFLALCVFPRPSSFRFSCGSFVFSQSV